MDTPIINPWFIYLANLLPTFNFAIVTATILLAIPSTCLLLAYLKTNENDYDYNRIKKYARTTCLCFFISLFLAIFVPSKSTIITMYAASKITPNNLKATGEVIDKGIDYIGGKTDKAALAITEDIIKIIDAANKHKTDKQAGEENK